ncbi:glycosyltransferase [Arhodomonas sp. AD133]|uniref:glycosyltransferase n=1 Tax=Arhodomonas sp. AD133 TaxID=3415009 RepID=UPI003EBB691D
MNDSPTPRLRFVVYWRQADWGFYHRRNEAFARALAKLSDVAEVVHVEAVSVRGLVANLVRAAFTRDRGLRRAYRLHVRKALSPRPVRVDDGLAVKSLVLATLGADQRLEAVNHWLMRRQVRSLRGPAPTVLLAYPPAPRLAELARNLRAELVLADLVDDVPALETDPDRRAARVQEYVEILPDCGAVFATSPRLAEAYGEYAPSGIEFLPNGVGVDDSPPPAAKDKERPRVGYIGALNRTLDTELVDRVLGDHPEVDFVFIGPLETSAAAFVRNARARHPNCHYLGPKRHGELRRHMAACDVLINVKRADVTTRGNDSIKIYEYLATGRPVVSTSMAPADRLRELLHVSDEPEGFSRMLGQALAEDDPQLAQQRRRVALDNAWERRVERIVTRVDELLEDAGPQPRMAGAR